MTDQTDGPPPAEWAREGEDEKGFWTRFKEAVAGAPGEAVPEAPPPPPPPPPLLEAKPRKIKRTVFDGGKKPETRGTRLRRISQEKRDNLALVVGAEMEKVIVEKIQPRDEELGRVADGFGTLNEVLSKIPESAGAQVEALGGQLTVLTNVQGELELHRAQRERVIEGVQRLEKAIQSVTEKIEAQSRASSDETDRIERTMAFFAARVHEQSSSILAAQEAAAENVRLSQGAIAQAFEDSQHRTIATVEKLLEERAAEAREKAAQEQRQALAERERVAREKEARRRQREARGKTFDEHAKEQRSRGRFARAVGALLVLALIGAGAAWLSLDEQRTSVARDTEERADRALRVLVERQTAATVSSRSASTTLPAGFAK